MKVAIVHDWLVVYAGAERVLEQMIKCYPEADVFSLIDFLPAAEREFLQDKRTTTSWLQRLPLARKYYRRCLSLMPLAIEQLDLSKYDLVLSSSHAVAKGVLTGPDQLHLSYVHSPMRYAWELQHQYLQLTGLANRSAGWAAAWMLHKMRIWDVRTANGVDAFMANSHFVKRRIWKAYRREAEVIYPPVDVNAFTGRVDKEAFYLTASRMVPYKRLDLIVEAFAGMPDKRLVVIGDGPEFKHIRAKANTPNIQLLGYQPDAVLRDYMQRAQAFLYAAEEDFGIVMAEAQAGGTPVIAYGKGGAAEIVRDLGHAEPPTGVLYGEQTASALMQAIRTFESNRAAMTSDACRQHAMRFSQERFRTQFRSFVERHLGAPD